MSSHPELVQLHDLIRIHQDIEDLMPNTRIQKTDKKLLGKIFELLCQLVENPFYRFLFRVNPTENEVRDGWGIHFICNLTNNEKYKTLEEYRPKRKPKKRGENPDNSDSSIAISPQSPYHKFPQFRKTLSSGDTLSNGKTVVLWETISAPLKEECAIGRGAQLMWLAPEDATDERVICLVNLFWKNPKTSPFHRTPINEILNHFGRQAMIQSITALVCSSFSELNSEVEFIQDPFLNNEDQFNRPHVDNQSQMLVLAEPPVQPMNQPYSSDLEPNQHQFEDQANSPYQYSPEEVQFDGFKAMNAFRTELDESDSVPLELSDFDKQVEDHMMDTKSDPLSSSENDTPVDYPQAISNTQPSQSSPTSPQNPPFELPNELNFEHTSSNNPKRVQSDPPDEDDQSAPKRSRLEAEEPSLKSNGLLQLVLQLGRLLL